MRKLFIILALLLSICGCSNNHDYTCTPQYNVNECVESWCRNISVTCYKDSDNNIKRITDFNEFIHNHQNKPVNILYISDLKDLSSYNKVVECYDNIFDEQQKEDKEFNTFAKTVPIKYQKFIAKMPMIFVQSGCESEIKECEQTNTTPTYNCIEK